MHYGDQFFFKPLFEKLKHANFPVTSIPSKSMEFLFDNHCNKEKLNSKNTLFVTSSRLLQYLKSRYGSNIKYFLYDTNALGVNEPITNYIVNKFAEYFNLNELLGLVTKEDFYVKNYKHKFNLLNKNEEYILFNNYYDSGLFRVFYKDKKIILETLLKEKNDHKVVHIGTSNDKKNDKNDYNGIIDIDLRGYTTIEDLYYIFSNFNVIRLYSFDTFTQHLANVFNVPVRLMLKRYFRRGEKEQKIKAFTTTYVKNVNNILIIDK